MKYLFAIVCLLSCSNNIQASLEVFSDDELLNLLNTEKFVVVLFTKKDCAECEVWETALLNVREDLVDQLNAYVVACVNSMLTKLYNPAKEPSIVFFRHGVPLLYDGAVNEELILHTISDNQEPSVRELSDDTFEHLTQASSGATTGDWFVMFYATNCVDCQRLQARWEAVGAHLKTRMNTARVNRQTTGRVTARRFGVVDTPAFILFRQGKMYRYNIPKYDTTSFVTFATDWFKNARSENVPAPKTPFDDLTLQIAEYIRENPWLLKLGSIALAIGVIASVIMRLNSKEEQKKKPAKKDNMDSKDKTKKAK